MQEVAPVRNEKVAIFYPWGDILERKGGASQRVGFLLEFLRDRGHQLLVAAPGVGQGLERDGVQYRWYNPSKIAQHLIRPVHRSYKAAAAVLSLGRSIDEDFMFWNHHELRLDPAFDDFVEEVVEWSDAVLLEYTFWGRQVMTAAERRGRKVIVTAHDVLAHQVRRTPWLRMLTMRCETRALKAAHHAICVSSGDRDIFRRYGVEAIIIPHGVDTQQHVQGESKNDLRRTISTLLNIDIPGGKICLFVGSLFAANITAVRHIRELAARMAPNGGGNICFVVAGGCCEPGIDVNFISLGRIEAKALDALYQLADIVLIPLFSGTGASVKTIEAMARAKVVLGTQVAFRGYAVTAGMNCLISDDLSAYPHLIRQMLEDDRHRRIMEAQAREFALRYDYRTVYETYTDLLKA